jgi:hypothetical protein
MVYLWINTEKYDVDQEIMRKFDNLSIVWLSDFQIFVYIQSYLKILNLSVFGFD